MREMRERGSNAPAVDWRILSKWEGEGSLCLTLRPWSTLGDIPRGSAGPLGLMEVGQKEHEKFVLAVGTIEEVR
jgi:hypothetical protein